MARLCSYITIQSHTNNRQVIRGIEANLQGDSIIESNKLCNQQSVLPSLLGSKHDYVRLLLHCICSTAIFKAHTAPKVISFKGRSIQKNYDFSALRSIVARNGHYLTYIGALVTLQIFLQMNRVNTTTSLLPMLFQTTSSRSKAAVFSKMVIILVNSCGILGSAFTTKHHGRAATLTVSIVLMVFCQVTNQKVQTPNSVGPVNISSLQTADMNHFCRFLLQDGDSIDRRIPHRAWRWKPNAERVHHCNVLAHLRRLLRPQLVMGLYVLDLSW